jgi:hypothetical protein
MSIERLGSSDPLSAYSKNQNTNRILPRGGADSINVSDEARLKSELFRLNQHVRNVDDLRMDRVEEVKLKLQDPNYINDTVVSTVANKIMGAFGLD